MFIRFDMIHERDRQTHTQTPHDGIGRAALMHRIARQKVDAGSTLWENEMRLTQLHHIPPYVDPCVGEVSTPTIRHCAPYKSVYYYTLNTITVITFLRHFLGKMCAKAFASQFSR